MLGSAEVVLLLDRFTISGDAVGCRFSGLLLIQTPAVRSVISAATYQVVMQWAVVYAYCWWIFGVSYAQFFPAQVVWVAI